MWPLNNSGVIIILHALIFTQVVSDRFCNLMAASILRSSVPRLLELKNTPTASLQRGEAPHDFPEDDTKQSDIQVPVMLELWGMQSTSSLSSLPGPLYPRVEATD